MIVVSTSCSDASVTRTYSVLVGGMLELYVSTLKGRTMEAMAFVCVRHSWAADSLVDIKQKYLAVELYMRTIACLALSFMFITSS